MKKALPHIIAMFGCLLFVCLAGTYIGWNAAKRDVLQGCLEKTNVIINGVHLECARMANPDDFIP